LFDVWEFVDGSGIHVKSMTVSRCVEKCDIERIIENLLNLRHPCISNVIGVVLPSQLLGLEIIGMDSDNSSLSKVISTSPGWWTPTTKTKAIVGIVLGLRYAHSLGLLHGNLTATNIFLDVNGLVEIRDFCVRDFAELGSDTDARANLSGFSGESWTPMADIVAFSRILSDIVVGASAGQGGCVPSVPSFVSWIIEEGQCRGSKSMRSFFDIFEILKRNQFRIM
jgi:serine/threonine protein kinase